MYVARARVCVYAHAEHDAWVSARTKRGGIKAEIHFGTDWRRVTRKRFASEIDSHETPSYRVFGRAVDLWDFSLPSALSLSFPFDVTDRSIARFNEFYDRQDLSVSKEST